MVSDANVLSVFLFLMFMLLATDLVADGVCVRSIDVHTHVITKIFVNNDLLFSSSYDKAQVV